MRTITLKASKRESDLGRGALNRMRKEGVLPAVIYGSKFGTLPVTVEKKEFLSVLNSHGANAIISLKVGEKSVQTMVKEIQTHPVTGHYWHVDFSEIYSDRKIRTQIPVNFVGEAAGQKEGGILQYGDTGVEVECLPANLPENFTLDISSLHIGDKHTVADLKTDEGIKILSEPEQVLISVIAPVMDAEDNEETGEDAEAASAGDIPGDEEE
ncbi:MAG: 50S ribosomal protein L25 [Bacillota bacterium]